MSDGTNDQKSTGKPSTPQPETTKTPDPMDKFRSALRNLENVKTPLTDAGSK